MKFFDSLVNLVTGLGTAKDKGTHSRYAFHELTPEQLIAAYRGDWIAGKIIDIPAEDATREWRRWQGGKDQISAIEAEETRLALVQKTNEALIKDRLFGGGAIVMGIDGAGEWDEPIAYDRIQKGALKFAHVVDRHDISAGQINRDLTSPYYGEPEYYQVTSDSAGSVTVHPSRVIRFVSRPLPAKRLETDGWGDSILHRLDTAIKQAGLASEGVASLIHEASVDIIRIPDFMANIATKEYRDRLIERFQLANIAKSTVNATILDKEEEWDKMTTNFANLPEIVRVYLNIAAGAGDIPATRLLGQAPNGLNATGDSDIRNYYDNVAAQQKNSIGPAMARLDEVLIRSALGERPLEIHYNWVPLWQPTDSEKADSLLKRSQAIANIYNTGYVPDEAMAKAVQNMLIEEGSLPGLEASIDEMDLDESDPETLAQFARTRSGA